MTKNEHTSIGDFANTHEPMWHLSSDAATAYTHGFHSDDNSYESELTAFDAWLSQNMISGRVRVACPRDLRRKGANLKVPIK